MTVQNTYKLHKPNKFYRSLLSLLSLLLIILILGSIKLHAISLQDKYGIKDTTSLILKIQLGLIPQAYIISPFGKNTDVGVLPETLSELSILQPYPLDFNSQAKQIQLISSGQDFTQIHVNGLDSNGNLQSETLTLNDGIPVYTTKTYSRLFDAYNDSSIPLIGNVTLSANGTVIGILKSTSQKLYNAVYTIPKGYTGYLIDGLVSSGKTKDITFEFVIRKYNKTFVTLDSVYTYESTVNITEHYQPIPELSDVEIRVSSTQNGSTAQGSFTLILIKNEVFN